MKDRSAVDTIRGYFYQFDLSILTLLKLGSLDDAIEIECIEDIDIRTATEVTATQCKYYSKTEYNHSVIKDAVMYMLSHFKEVKRGLKPRVVYAIRGHYSSGQEKLASAIDVGFLKTNFLTYTYEKIKRFHHDELGLSDEDLEEFLLLFSVDVNSPKFEDQFNEIVQNLEHVFSCKRFAAEFFFYNNALALIRDLAIKPSQTERSITKREFLEKVNTSSILFNEWFVQKKGKKSHLASLRLEYFTDLNVSPFERFFLLEINPSSYVRDELKDLVFTLAKKWSKSSKYEPNPFCPYLFIHQLPVDELVALKRDLSAEGFKFIDGYDFLGADFNPNSIVQRATYLSGIRIKILNTSADLLATIDRVTKTRKIYQFHLGSPYFNIDNSSVGHVKIQVEQLSDIKSII